MAERIIDKEVAQLAARLSDLTSRCLTRGIPVFLGFLDTAQRTVATERLKHFSGSIVFWGGYPDAERTFLGLSADSEPPAKGYFPFRCVQFRWREEDSLTHRDFLGSLMALGIKREAVGDIAVEPGCAVAFLSEHAAQVALSEITKIGRAGVTVTEIPVGSKVPERSFLPVTGTVASLRLDCVTALLSNNSRSASAKCIVSGLVAVNGIAETSVDRLLAPGDKLSIRGTGKFLFEGQDGVSRKDKLRLKFQKYQ
ncbi:MAG: YlmH/Sll1252 family protein [Angelakisella sp.]